MSPPSPLPLWVTGGGERMRNTGLGVCIGPAAAPGHVCLDREAEPFRKEDEENENAIS